MDSTIDIILNCIYDKKELTTNAKRKDMRDLILLCTKNVHFTFNNDIYKQTDGVALGSPLGPVLAGIIMAELENTVVAWLFIFLDTICRWYLDICKGRVNHICARIIKFLPPKFTIDIWIGKRR